MQRTLIISLIFSILTQIMGAQESSRERRLFWGLEWGAGSDILRHDNFQFRSPEGFAVDGKHREISPHPQGSVAFFAGLRSGRKFSAGIWTGYEGVSEGIRLWPLTLRLAYNFSDKRGHTLFAGGGPAFPDSGLEKPAKLLQAGYCKDTDIGFGCRLRFLLTGEMTLASPHLVDHHTGEFVPKEDVWKSDSTYLGAKLSVALVF